MSQVQTVLLRRSYDTSSIRQTLFTTKNLRIELPSLHTGMFVEGAEPLSPFNEHSRLGFENSDTLASL
jgi:hypothetical protein